MVRRFSSLVAAGMMAVVASSCSGTEQVTAPTATVAPMGSVSSPDRGESAHGPLSMAPITTRILARRATSPMTGFTPRFQAGWIKQRSCTPSDTAPSFRNRGASHRNAASLKESQRSPDRGARGAAAPPVVPGRIILRRRRRRRGSVLPGTRPCRQRRRRPTIRRRWPT